MYPYLRFLHLTLTQRRKPALGLFDTHRLGLTCWPVDIDGFFEMNNGRVLTLYDLGRFGASMRNGFWDMLKRERLGLVVAGSTVRYRARVTPFQRVELRTRFLGWDDRFLYVEQAMWRGETCCNHALIRAAVTRNRRMIPATEVARAMGVEGPGPALPDWVTAWSEADATRLWPPEV